MWWEQLCLTVQPVTTKQNIRFLWLYTLHKIHVNTAFETSCWNELKSRLSQRGLKFAQDRNEPVQHTLKLFGPQSPCIVENVFEYDTERRKYWICTGLFVARSWKHHFTSESTTRSLFQPELVQNDVFAYRTWMQRLNSFEWVRSRWETILPIRIRQVPMLDMESMH